MCAQVKKITKLQGHIHNYLIVILRFEFHGPHQIMYIILAH